MFGTVYRWDASATNEMNTGVFSQNYISFNEANNDIANTGTISDVVNIDIGDSGLKGYKQGTHLVHRISIFNTALSDTNIFKCFGLTNTTWQNLDFPANGDHINGQFHMATKFKSFNDVIGKSPIHDWNFTKRDPLASGYSALDVKFNIADTGTIGGLTLTPVGTPVVGRQPNV